MKVLDFVQSGGLLGSRCNGPDISTEGHVSVSQLTLQSDRHASTQPVPGKINHSQNGETAQLWRHHSVQLVSVKKQTFQIREAAQLLRNLTAQPVQPQAYAFQSGELTKLWRYFST